MMPLTIKPEGAAGGAQVGSVRVSMRNYFSTYMLWAAQHMSSLAGRVEQSHQGGSRFDLEHRGYVLSSILAAAAFLEAMINELYEDAYDGHGVTGDGYIAPLTDNTRRLMADLWRSSQSGKRLNVLSKYELLLSFAGEEPLDRGNQPYQDAQLVLRLRNALAHFHPTDLAADDPAQMEKMLRGSSRTMS